jgi:PTH1 family peptidyl-tRNA hydrolase
VRINNMKLIVGLGNPGKAYAHSRHNIGFRCINYLAKLYAIPVKKHQCHSQIGTGKIAGVEVLLAKPKTFVNMSGEAVGRLMHKYNIPVNDLLIIYDDLDLPLGKIRIRHGGSAGGHKGIKSIISAIGNQDFPRIKVGIGRPTDKDDTPISDEEAIVGYVLSDFIPAEDRIIKPAVSRVAEAVQCFLAEDIIAAMNKFN